MNSKLTAGQYSDQGHTVNINDGATVLVYVILGVFFEFRMTELQRAPVACAMNSFVFPQGRERRDKLPAIGAVPKSPTSRAGPGQATSWECSLDLPIELSKQGARDSVWVSQLASPC